MSRYQQYLDDIYAKKIDIKKEEALLAAKRKEAVVGMGKGADCKKR